jgi:tRNA dimethylallyltransferase
MEDIKLNNELSHADYNLPLVVIAGPTASGKTSLAIKLAKECGGEIICADSRSIYKYMDIGTAKPSKIEQGSVKHWGLDLVNPNEYYSAADFKTYALEKISDIRLRGKVPFLVGGSGLYIDSIIFDYQFGDKADVDKRAELNNMTIEQLQEYCINNNIRLPENAQNKRYVIRSIEQNGLNESRSTEPINNVIIVGITTDRDVLRDRIEHRIEQLFDYGVVNEAKMLGEIYGWECESFKGNVYPLAHSYLLGQITLEEMKLRLVSADYKLAKRQLTWFRRNSYMKWGSADESYTYVLTRLAKLVQS